MSIIWKTRYKGILIDILTPKHSNGKGLIVCPGLPSIPTSDKLNVLVDEGYFVFHFRYRGTWESDGEFLDSTPVEDVRDVVEMILSGGCTELYNNSPMKFPRLKIGVIGSSFGGTVALASTGISHISFVIALCPVVDFSTQGMGAKEQDLEHLGDFLIRVYGRCYCMKKERYTDLLRGNILKTPTSCKQPVFVIQGDLDTTISPLKVEDYVDRLHANKKLYKSLPNRKHLSISDIDVSLLSKITDFLDG